MCHGGFFCFFWLSKLASLLISTFNTEMLKVNLQCLNVCRGMLSYLYIGFIVLFTVLACHLVAAVGHELISFTGEGLLSEMHCTYDEITHISLP